MLFIDASNDSLVLNREVMKKGQNESFVDDQGELVWISLPSKSKLKLQKRGLFLAKNQDGNVIVFKKNDPVGQTKRYDNSYSFNSIVVDGDRFLISPQLNNKDIRALSKYLKLKFEMINKNRISLFDSVLKFLFPKKKVLAFSRQR